MRPEQLRSAREAAGLTQQQAAGRLGVSQAYLALLERGRRPVTAGLRSKIVNLYGLGPTDLPLETECVDSWQSASLATALASLGYPGFRHLRGGDGKNPAVVLLAAIAAGDVEVRVIEALPWLVVAYSDLDWEWLIREAKLRDVQNRLGFLVTLARQVAEKRGDKVTAGRLCQVEEILDRARLVREDTLCQGSLSDAERRWLRRTRPPDARHWNLLTDLDSRALPYAA
ncbi:MAG: helix-turn-helix transcriptional regulator [Acidobacteriota bacterium]